MDPAQFQTICTIVRTEVQKALAESASPWRDRHGAAAYLQCGITKIDELVGEGKLPRKFFDGRPRFKVSDLDALLSDKRQTSTH